MIKPLTAAVDHLPPGIGQLRTPNALNLDDPQLGDLREAAESRSKLVHTFGALAELGHEVASRSNFQETIRTSLHLILGSLGIMRGGVARYSRFEHEMNLLAVRGMGDNFPLSLELCYEDERQFLMNGLVPIEVTVGFTTTFRGKQQPDRVPG